MNAIVSKYQRIRKESEEHLKETRQSYCTHLLKHVGTAVDMMYAATALLIHGAIPAWCKKTGNQMILRAADGMEEHPDHKQQEDA